MSIDAKTDPYVLKGRVVTMGPAGVIDEGSIYIQSGIIKHVLHRGAPRPSDFLGASVIKTGGTIFPGLIELHNHLSYNAIPLWDVPRQYAHSGSWQGTDEYKANITKPAQVLANTAGSVEALVRFVECRCLLGGVTTSQGLTLSSKPGITVKYKGLVRNVEKPLVEGLSAAGAKIGAPDKDLVKYQNKLEAHKCYLQHLSEGLGATPRKQFLRLQRENGSWALHPSFCGLHCTALTPEDFQILAKSEHRGSIVWSPLSNLLLYGGTTNVKAARDAGLPIALGSDWAPSGTKNLLGELKVARLVSEAQGWDFTDRELCEMVTSTPAKILSWENKLGTIQSNKLADLIVVDDTTEDPFQQLVEARETSITLVVIDGIPRVGQARMMKRFGPGTEEIKVGSSKRVLDLSPTVDPDPTGGISLTEATNRLRNSLASLPELAEQLDAALGAGWEPTKEFVMGNGVSLSNAGLPDDWRPPVFTVLHHFQQEDEERDPSFGLAAGDLADWVDPMVLEGITVPDDRKFFTKLASAGNLPQYVKTGLPPLYGARVPSIAFLDAAAAEFDASLQASCELWKVRDDTRSLRIQDRLRIIDQAIALLERHYVHLPMKRSMHAVDPIQRLRVLRFEIEQENPKGLDSDLNFHLTMTEIMHSVRDLHTTYRLPHPYRRQVAWLPYIIEECHDKGRLKFIVSLVVGEVGPPTFKKGVEVIHWNGTPIDRFVEQLARQMPAGNAAARRARAINALTIRPLARGHVPVEDWVTLRYRTETTSPRTVELRYPWLVFEPSRRRRVLSPEDGVALATALGLDDNTDAIHQVKKLFYAGHLVQAEEAALASGKSLEVPVSDDQVLSQLPTLFRARRVRKIGAGEAVYGYLRIFSFNVDDADAFVGEFERLLGELPDRGLIIDLRGNAGGLIHAAERVLELISPRRIDPERAQFINSPANLELCRQHAPSQEFKGFSLENWIDSMEMAVTTAATHSFGFPITDPKDCNLRGQRYQGPVVLIIDGLCYSATDMFAAGFQDHGLGRIIGLDANTGAGGANFWSHAVLRRLAGPNSGLRRLPGGADLRVAIRRTLRVGPNAGELVEDFGVQIDEPYQLTKNDVLNDNRDLIQMAIEVLAAQPQTRLSLDQRGDRIQIHTKNVDWVEATVGNRSLRARDVEGGQAVIQLDELPNNGPHVLEVVGMRDNNPVVRAQLQVNRG
jgi:cytosine/adenosine deaminase-related metal-dependent hydrolase